MVGDLRRISFNYQSLDKQGEIFMTNFVLPRKEIEPVMSKHQTQNRADNKILKLKEIFCTGDVIVVENMVI